MCFWKAQPWGELTTFQLWTFLLAQASTAWWAATGDAQWQFVVQTDKAKYKTKNTSICSILSYDFVFIPTDCISIFLIYHIQPIESSQFKYLNIAGKFYLHLKCWKIVPLLSPRLFDTVCYEMLMWNQSAFQFQLTRRDCSKRQKEEDDITQ